MTVPETRFFRTQNGDADLDSPKALQQFTFVAFRLGAPGGIRIPTGDDSLLRVMQALQDNKWSWIAWSFHPPRRPKLDFRRGRFTSARFQRIRQAGAVGHSGLVCAADCRCHSSFRRLVPFRGQMNEDQNRTQTGCAAENSGLLGRLALNQLRRDTLCQTGIKGKELNAPWNPAYLQSLRRV